MPPSIGRSGAGRDHHGPLAGAAGVARAARDAHPQLRGHDVELLGAQFVDHVQRTAAARAVTVLDVDHHLVARQMRRQRAVIAIGPSFAPLPLRVLPPRPPRPAPAWFSATVCSRSSSPNCSWSGVELLGAAAELVAQQALDQQPQLVVLGMQFRMLLRRRGDHIAQHLLQDGGVVRQGVEVDLHAAMMNNAPASAPALRSTSALFYPASSGLRRVTGARHSQPSSSVASCAAESAIRTRGRRRRPDELAVLEPLGQQAQADPVVPEQLDQPGTAATKGKQRPTERILRQALLHQHRQADHPLAHVGDAAGQIDPHPGGRRDHRPSSAASTRRSARLST